MADGYFFSFGKLSYIKADKSKECILCKIVGNDAETNNLTVLKEDLFSASLNLYPYNPGHLLLFPNRHVEDVRALTEEEHARLARLVSYFLDVLERVYRPEGFNIGYNMGRVSGASLVHLHLHIIPRYPSEIGLADLVAGKRVLIEDPRESLEKMKAAVLEIPPPR